MAKRHLEQYDKNGNKLDIYINDDEVMAGGKTLMDKLAEMQDDIDHAGQGDGTVTGVKVGSTPYNPDSNGVVDLSVPFADKATKTELQNAINSLQSALDTLIGSGNVQGAIDTFNEVKAFLNGIDTSDPTLFNQLKSLSDAITALQATLNSKANDADVVKSVSVNGTEQPKDTSGNVNVSVPTMTLDDAPTAGSNNPVKSGGVKQAIDNKLTEVVVNEMSGAADIITIDDADLAFIDEDGNIAMRVAEGHVETQNFDSRQVSTNTSAIQQLQSQIGQQGSAQTDVVVKEDADAAFDIADESGRVALRITSKGHIKTKGFDSENMDIFRATKLDSPQCVCHGYGSVSSVQANTLAYFRAGYTAGYRFFECDALNCSDGVPVCTHDDTNGLTVYDKTTHEATNVSIASVSGTRTIQMSSTELVEGYTWDSAGNVPIALLSEVIWQVCYFYRCPLHVDGQGLNKASRLAASQYAESLGVGQYVFHELSGGAYTDWQIPCNAIIYTSSVADIQTKAASYKKSDNNIIFYLDSSASTATIQALADAAHEAGCYLMSWTYSSSAAAREWFTNGADFIITSNSITNNKI